MQRQCVAIEGADWVGSGVSNNLDQAHKMLGMHADGDLNVISVPVYYSKQLDSGLGAWWWWYRQETAVGLMTWDLRKYDPARAGRPAEGDRELRQLRPPARGGAPLDPVPPPGAGDPAGA